MRTPQNPQLTEDVLYKMYIEQGMSAKDIADKLEVSPTSVYNACYKFGLKKRHGSSDITGAKTKDHRKDFPRSVLHNLYITQNKTIEETASELGTNTTIIYKLLREYGIKKSMQAYKRGKCPTKAELEKMMARTNGNASKIAQEMGVTRMTVYNWIRQHGLSTKRENQNDTSLLSSLAIEQHKPLSEIAKELGCAERVAKKNLESNGFELYIAKES